MTAVTLNILRPACSTLMLAALAGAVNAAVIANYDFGASTPTPTASFASADTDLGTTASDLDDSVLAGSINEIVTTTGTKINNFTGVAAPAYQASSNNFNTNSSFGDDAGRYWAFSITAVNNVTAWDELNLDRFRSDDTEYALRLLTSTTDTDGTFTQVGSATDFGPGANNDGNRDTWTAIPAIDLSSLPALTAGNTRYFRLQAAANAGNLSAARSLGLDNITVTATVVPEPTSAAVIALSLVGLLSFVRRWNR